MPDKSKSRLPPWFLVLLPGILLTGALFVFWEDATPEPHLTLDYPREAKTFLCWEVGVGFPEPMSFLAGISATEIHDAYDADRDGEFVRLTATFTQTTSSTKQSNALTVPGFAMKDKHDSPWAWKVRWNPKEAGTYSCKVEFMAAVQGREPIQLVEVIEEIIVTTSSKDEGQLVAPSGDHNWRYLRVEQADGSTKAQLLLGTCRAWVIRSGHHDSLWGEEELCDLKGDVITPMREGGMNLLGYWMAPWEYLLVHHDQAEHWLNETTGDFDRVPIAEDADWSSHRSYDQGRAKEFDRLLRICEGEESDKIIRLLLSPLPHPVFRDPQHEWFNGSAAWSPWHAPEVQKASTNGFCLDENMDVWDFFKATPNVDGPSDSTGRLFDHQANYYRYLFARWGYSTAVGIWVLLDEVEGIGEEEGYWPDKSGFWGHPECEIWLKNMTKLFRGQLSRGFDGLRYQGDPYHHPIQVSTTGAMGQGEIGGNLDWTAGQGHDRPDLMGWHWYPSVEPPVQNWEAIWLKNLRGIHNYSLAPHEGRPRLISEFGAADRAAPEKTPSYLYPTLFHHAAWAAALSGHAGIPLDWNDGKEFGELRYRGTSAFSAKTYPIDLIQTTRHLSSFLANLNWDLYRPQLSPEDSVQCLTEDGAHVSVLYNKEKTVIMGWLFRSVEFPQLRILGLAPGQYTLNWFDPWEGKWLERTASYEAQEGKVITIDSSEEFRDLTDSQKIFPDQIRELRGRDIAFRMTRN